MPISGSTGYRSGIISLPNRVRLRAVDCLTGSYPSQLRTTGFSGSQMGNGAISFNDTRTLVFNQSQNAVFPLCMPQVEINKADTTSVIATPNIIGYFSGTGTSSPVLSTQGFRSFYDGGMPLTPFNENRIFLGDRSSLFYASGTSRSTYSGFESPVRDKIAINIPINNVGTDKLITRYNTSSIKSVAGGEFDGELVSGSGFYYYNHDLSQWQDIGLTDAYGGNTHYTMFYRTTDNSLSTLHNKNPWVPGAEVTSSVPTSTPLGWDQIVWGRLPKMQQFRMSDHMGVFIGSDADATSATEQYPYSVLTRSLAYDKIGSPTMAGLAPFHQIYHATGSQVLDMSSYISHPFVLERAVIDIPVTVQRRRGGLADPSGPLSRFYDSCRDIDNYVFFIYRQSKNGGNFKTDSLDHISGSTRMLICSGSAAFYNSNAFSGDVPAAIQERGLPHTPAFSHDFLAAKASTLAGEGAIPLVNAFSGTIRINMTPAVGNCQLAGGSRFPLAGNPDSYPPTTPVNNWQVSSGVRSIVTQDFWPGGTTWITSSGAYFPISSIQVANPRNAPVFLNGGGDPAVSLAGSLSTPGLITGKRDPVIVPTTPLKDLLKTHQGHLALDRRPLAHPVGETALLKTTIPILPYGGTSGRNTSGIIGYTNFSPSTLSQPIGFGGLPSSILSPYILLPEDTLVIGLDAGISMLPSSGTAPSGESKWAGTTDAGVNMGFYSASSEESETFGCMSGSYMRILQGEASLTLFGSLVRNDKELLFNANQNLTSDAIHEVIGNDRIVDQFDIPTRLDLSSSYVDRYIGGGSGPSLLHSTSGEALAFGIQNFVHTPYLQRRVIGNFSKARQGLTASINGFSNPQPVYGTPLSNYWTGTPPNWWQSPGTDPTRATTTADPANDYINLDDFNIGRFRATLVESAKIRSLQRFVTFPDETEQYYDTIPPDIADLASRSKSLHCTRINSGVFEHRVQLLPKRIMGYPYAGNPTRYVSQKYFLRMFVTSGSVDSPGYYDFKSTEQPVLVNTSLFQRGYVYGAFDTKLTSPDRWYYFAHPMSGAFGPMYGMMGPRRKGTNAVFRRDRYGQFRDMLEQRLDGKFFVSKDDKPGYVDDSPIQIKFVKSSDGITPVSPFETNSFNFSTEHTSSYPFNEHISDDNRPSSLTVGIDSIGSGPLSVLGGSVMPGGSSGLSTILAT